MTCPQPVGLKGNVVVDVNPNSNADKGDYGNLK